MWLGVEERNRTFLLWLHGEFDSGAYITEESVGQGQEHHTIEGSPVERTPHAPLRMDSWVVFLIQYSITCALYLITCAHYYIL